MSAGRTDHSGNGNTVTDNRAMLGGNHISYIRRVERAEMPGIAVGTDFLRYDERSLGIHKYTEIGNIDRI